LYIYINSTEMAKMSKMSSKLAKCNMGSSNSFMSSLFILVVYVAIAYIVYRVIMYFLNMRSSAMPNAPAGRNNGAGGDGGCSSGTCSGSGGGAGAGAGLGMMSQEGYRMKNSRDNRGHKHRMSHY